MFMSRLADQRARLVVMLRRGDIPEELENEKIVELQLQKKQREVESKLSFVIKKLADLKYTDDPLKQCQVKEQHPTGTQAFRELQLKEKSTRQKLLARREEMRNFGFPSATISGQSTPSSSRIRFGTGHSSLSDASSVTSPWEDGGRESAVSSIPASNRKNLIAKHAASKGGLSDSSHHVHKVTPSSQNYFAKRGFPRQQRFPSKDKCGMSRNDRPKSCLLVKFMNDSHQALYHKSTFPRRIESGAHCDMRGTKSARAQRTMSGIQRARAKNVPNLARSSSSGCLKLEEQSSDSSKAERVPILHPVTANAAENQAETQQPRRYVYDIREFSPVVFWRNSDKRVKRRRDPRTSSALCDLSQQRTASESDENSRIHQRGRGHTTDMASVQEKQTW
ncbi:hypothetical protein OS493_035147 [Desmophyllum pertusum]|uniref:Uncharacterized protein n=1 Tax=Desmophyllum pertusum TaxID=174260 RepID=A0A9W9YV35_9CNID|nr:hypothetical protein OS493_035147 [Desmophyllum pertusum]